jgi:hypothetical protein
MSLKIIGNMSSPTSTYTLLRKFHQSGIFLVASLYRATYFGYEGGRGIDQKMTYFSVVLRYWFHSEWYGEWNFQSRIPYKIPLPDKNSTLYLYVPVRIAKSWSSICTAAPHWWHFVDLHNDAAILVQRMLFSFGSCVIIIQDTQQMSSVLKSGRKWPFISTASWSAYCKPSSCIPPRGEFCAPHLMTKLLCKQFSFHLSHECSPSQRYYRQGLYGKVRENGRMCQQRHVCPTAS